MSDETTSGSARPVSRGVDPAARHSALTARLRCTGYAAWSELLASPHEVDVRVSLQKRLGIGSELESAQALDALIHAYLQFDPQELRRQYSGLFEVGSDGPPVPLREDLQTGQRAGTREDLVRFYDYFDYRLAPGFAWQPDHLSVELEFMHYLCYREATVDESDASSFQLAQVDFATRHLANWVPGLSAQVSGAASGSLFANVLSALGDFVTADLRWQATTITQAGTG